jgi:deoxyribodipyrimidine photo-lyase
MSSGTVSILWFRRDLRLSDHPALVAACQDASLVLPLFVIDPQGWKALAAVQRDYLVNSLAALDKAMNGALVVRVGTPSQVVRDLAREVQATAVHVSADFTPEGIACDEDVEKALMGDNVAFERTGSSYAVSPGRILKSDGAPYSIFTAFYRAWRGNGWRTPAPKPAGMQWVFGVQSDGLAAAGGDFVHEAALSQAGEAAAKARWANFRRRSLDTYDSSRDRPDLRGSSRLSPSLRFGEIHPRTLLRDLKRGKSDEVFRRELAWREFYADVLFHHPATQHDYMRAEYAAMPYDSGPRVERHIEAWRTGRTGYPIVDAGMRQLLAEGWIHNRVRMIVASFLIKDLHVEWQVGAAWFMQHLLDGDVASNTHNWQWVAGSGTDAAPYFRVFNPVSQALKFDPDGAYVRRFVPELSHLDGAAAHEPWKQPSGFRKGYPQRIVEHAVERRIALDRYELIRRR